MAVGRELPHEAQASDLLAPTFEERRIFDPIVRPDDSYDTSGVYWGDMSWGQRFSFVSAYDSIETRREWGNIWRMFKADPLAPFVAYFRNMVLPGAGLGLEGYVLFSIGNIKPLFAAPGAWPQCWKTFKVCSSTWVAAVEYLEICGIIVGQILVGIVGDALGRRFGLIQDVVIMFLGLVGLVAAWWTSLEGWVILYVWLLFFYGIGVGGEYPMTATSGMESVKLSSKEDRLHRGRKVTSAFLMQGWGQMFNQVALIVLLIIFTGGQTNFPYSQSAVQATYRVSFAIPAVGTLWLVYHRIYKMPVAPKQKGAHVTGYDAKSLGLTVSCFGSRLLATAGGWYANDVFFYGNKLFQSEFIAVIAPTSKKSVLPSWEYNLINLAVSLCGYYLASFTIDNKMYGRKKMQVIGFMADFIFFVIPAFNFEWMVSPAGVTTFQTLYFLSSFFNQFGPNSVSFLVAAECFPTSVRATAHGFAAAMGKLGALTAAVMYSYIDTQTKFYVVPWFGLAGAILTLIFLPDTTGLDLAEQERRWRFIYAGRSQDYHGVAVHRQHLSWWESWMGVGKHYEPDTDYRQKIEELRADWLVDQAQRADEKDFDHRLKSDGYVDNSPVTSALPESRWTPDMDVYFRATTGRGKLSAGQKTTRADSAGSTIEMETFPDRYQGEMYR